MLKNFLKLLSGNGIAQGLQLLSLIFLSIIYTPDDFGVLGKIQSIAAIVVILITLQLQYVIPLSEDNSAVKKNTINVFQITLLTSFLLLIISLFIGGDYTYALVIAFSTAITSVMTNYTVYHGNFSTLSIMYVLRAISIISLQILFFYLAIPKGLLYGAIFGEILSCILFIIITKSFFSINLRVNLKSLFSFIKKWKPYSMYGTIQELLSVMVYTLPMIFYVDKFGDNIGGQYSIAYKLIWAPTVLISSSLAQLLTHRFGKDKDFSFLKNAIWFDKRILFLIPFLIIGLFQLNHFSDSLFEGKWSICITLLPYMFINALFFLYANPFRVALRVKKLNVIILMVEAFTLILMSITFYFADIDVLLFTVIITAISVIQNLLISASYFLYNKRYE